jgi:ATP-binding protein involved in chromosome partitioning
LKSSERIDPRIRAAEERLSDVARVLCVAGGKGGVGKSLVCASAALILADRGRRVGVLDLDFHGPSGHVILGAEALVPEEDRGVVPPEIAGVKLMSIAPYIGERPSALRGRAITNVILEMLAITRWGRLDFLLVDMPPGTGEEVLDVAKLVPEPEFVVVSTPSELAIRTVRRLLFLLKELEVPILGVLENMSGRGRGRVESMCAEVGVPFLGSLPYDPEVELAVGDPARLRETRFARELGKVLGRIDAGAGRAPSIA